MYAVLPWTRRYVINSITKWLTEIQVLFVLLRLLKDSISVEQTKVPTTEMFVTLPNIIYAKKYYNSCTTIPTAGINVEYFF